MRSWRLILAVTGTLLGGYGVGRLLTEIPSHDLTLLAGWLIGALIIHDGILSPVVVTVGWFLRRVVPDRARRFLQAGLIMGTMVTIIAVPMIYRRNSQPPSKAILLQNFGGNLTLLLGLIGGLTLLGYAVRVAREQSQPGKPPARR
jgi:hypothetical protein